MRRIGFRGGRIGAVGISIVATVPILYLITLQLFSGPTVETSRLHASLLVKSSDMAQERHNEMNTRQYADLFFKCEYGQLEAAFHSLRYRVRRRKLAEEVFMELRNSLSDRIISLFGEETKGAWRVLRAGRVLAYCFDEDMRLARDITEEERQLLKDLDISI